MKLKKLDYEEKLTVIRIVISAILTLVAYLMPQNSIAILIYLVAFIIVGYQVLWKALKNILYGQVFDENFLMLVATLGAFAIHQYPEAVMVILLYEVGEFFQDTAVKSSQESVTNLLDNRPSKTIRIVNGKEEQVLSQSVKVGDTLVIKPGDKVPVDGIIILGEADVNTAALTGESVSRHLELNDHLLSGMIVEDGVLKVKVTHAYADSTVAKILDLVENASSRKAKTENFITKFSRIYTPIVVAAAVLLAVIPPLFMHTGIQPWISRALIFLVISCPCALVISVPLSYFSGIGAASKMGALVKGSNYLEALAQVNGVIFDKTGTLTQGKFMVTKVYAQDGFTEEKVLRLAALVEQHSPHPIAQAVVKSYVGKLDSKVECVKELVGLGVKARIDGCEVYVGNAKLMQKYHIKGFNIPKFKGTMVFVAIDGRYLGSIKVEDTLKPTAKETIERLEEIGIDNIMMLTGDDKNVGEKMAHEVGIAEVKTNLMPQDKVSEIAKFHEEHPDEKVAFVGDGLNDTPSLALADVGVSMGALGSDAAIEASDVVLIHDDPAVLPKLIQLAHKTKTIVYENISISLGMKAIFLVLGGFGLVSMWEAVFADVGVTLIAIINSLRLLRKKEIKTLRPNIKKVTNQLLKQLIND